MEQRYIDGVKDISITGGMVRVNCFAMTGTVQEGDEQRVQAQASVQMVMTAETFLRFHSASTQFFEELKKRGILQEQKKTETASADTITAEAVNPSGS